jgi:hypothetical protein
MSPAAALSALPFVDNRELQVVYGQSSVTWEAVPFPVSRIISNSRGVDWSGKGERKTLEDGRSVLSLMYATDIARSGAYNDLQVSPVTLRLFRDETGELWGRAKDGTHRIMGAKLNDEAVIVANVEVAEDPGLIDYYAGNVRAEQAEKSTGTPKKSGRRLARWLLKRAP